jgi:hypothetical protein
VCTSYNQLVDKKQFYRAGLAIVSHPPVDAVDRDTNDRSASAGRLASSGPRELFGRISPAFRIIWSGSLSGLPLLAYASHILWQCRALEELYDLHDGKLVLGVTGNISLTQLAGIGTAQIAGDSPSNIDKHLSSLDSSGYSYFRVLLALALTSMLLELGLVRSVLRRIDGILNFDGYRTTPRQLLSQRAMCSIASLSTAILHVYASHFPHTPPPVLPFVRVEFLSSPGFSRLISVLILTVLSHGINPFTSVISGLWSGSLWSWGLTSFLGTRYWGNTTLFISALGMLLSLKAQPSYSTYLKVFVPCIEYVAWDEHGEIPNGRGGTPQRNGSGEEDLEMSSLLRAQREGHSSEGETFPRDSSHSSLSGGSNNAIRGRVPIMNSIDSDMDLEGTVPAASSRFVALQRRAF